MYLKNPIGRRAITALAVLFALSGVILLTIVWLLADWAYLPVSHRVVATAIATFVGSVWIGFAALLSALAIGSPDVRRESFHHRSAVSHGGLL
ncbi:MAG TPA: hypothetical protein VFI91_08100 [Longimicrobiaceae bacterium]|nr:hypothetical protein [Longimicrobiaceae bacterium]